MWIFARSRLAPSNSREHFVCLGTSLGLFPFSCLNSISSCRLGFEMFEVPIFVTLPTLWAYHTGSGDFFLAWFLGSQGSITNGGELCQRAYFLGGWRLHWKAKVSSFVQGMVTRQLYEAGKWTHPEIMVVVHCKRNDLYIYIYIYGPTANWWPPRWRGMRHLKKNGEMGVVRSKNQRQDKWEQLSANFKKVYDYKCRIPSGQRVILNDPSRVEGEYWTQISESLPWRESLPNLERMVIEWVPSCWLWESTNEVHHLYPCREVDQFHNVSCRILSFTHSPWFLEWHVVFIFDLVSPDMMMPCQKRVLVSIATTSILKSIEGQENPLKGWFHQWMPVIKRY